MQILKLMKICTFVNDVRPSLTEKKSSVKCPAGAKERGAKPRTTEALQDDASAATKFTLLLIRRFPA